MIVRCHFSAKQARLSLQEIPAGNQALLLRTGARA